MPRTDRPADQHDASRREFFRTFSRQTVHNAGAVIGAATELRRTGLEAARELLGNEQGQALAEPTPPAAPQLDSAAPDSGWSYRSAYRVTADGLLLLDQRELPGRVTEVTVSDASEAASAIRAGVVNGGPVAGQVAAYAMVIAARSALDRSEAGRQQQIRAAAGALRAARPELRVVTFAMDAMEARLDAALDSGVAPTDIVAALQAEADRIAGEANVAHAAIGRLAAESIASAGSADVVNLLLHGDLGPLSCGMVGIGTTLVRALADAGLTAHAWVTEAGPGREGSRIGALQLAQNDVPHTVIPDAAVGWLLANRRIHAALLRGDRVAVNGDVGTIVGGLGVAQLAAQSDVPVYALAPSAALDPSIASGAEMGVPQSSSAEALAARLAAGSESASRAAFGAQLQPAADVVPAGLITRLVTETKVQVAPLGAGRANR